MALRANWRGWLKVAEVSCPVALYTAVSPSARISLHTINRETGHRVRRQYVDSESGKPVEADDQVKGYETSQGEFIVLEPEDVAAAIPGSDKTLTVSAFIPCDQIDTVYFERPYYLGAGDAHAADAFALIREGMKSRGVAALASTVLFRRVRSVLIRAHDDGMIATTLNFDYEVRSSSEAFSDIPSIKIKGEMLELGKHIIRTTLGKFDPSAFEDRYEQALADLVKAKIEGKAVQVRKPKQETNVVNLLEALRQSAGVSKAKPPKTGARQRTSSSKGAARPKAVRTSRASTKPRRKAS